MNVIVVGSGVIGLTCALRLAADGHAVRVWTTRPPEETTSAVAGGLVYPHLVGPPERVRTWTAVTLERFRDLADDPSTGVRVLSGRLLFRSPRPWPDWADAIPGLTRVSEPAPPYRDGFSFVTPVVAMGRYLRWLVAQADAAGVVVERRHASDVASACRHADMVVNATGSGARDLVDDMSVIPVRGQVVRTANPGIAEWVVDEDHPDGVTYVIPHADHVVCGGTEEPGATELTPDPDVAAAILDRCRRLVPALAQARVLGHAVGLRPYRPEVRLERVEDVIHCYGHGGAGVTLSWGCADEVVSLVAGTGRATPTAGS